MKHILEKMFLLNGVIVRTFWMTLVGWRYIFYNYNYLVLTKWKLCIDLRLYTQKKKTIEGYWNSIPCLTFDEL